MNKKEIEELKRLLFQDRLTQYGKRMLVQYLEQKESILDRVTDKLKELNQKYKNEYKIVECLDLIDPNLTALQELSCIRKRTRGNRRGLLSRLSRLRMV